MSNQEDLRRPKKLLEKMREIDNKARVSKKDKMKRKFNRNQQRITLSGIQLSSLIFLVLLDTLTLTKDMKKLTGSHLFVSCRAGSMHL